MSVMALKLFFSLSKRLGPKSLLKINVMVGDGLYNANFYNVLQNK